MNAEFQKLMLIAEKRTAEKTLSRLTAWHEGVRGEDLQDDAETLAEIENTYSKIQELTQQLKGWKKEK